MSSSSLHLLPPPVAAPPPPAPAACDGCRAPLAPDQRYCVQCGMRRRDGNDPVARYLADASRRTRTVAAAPTTPPPPRRRGPGIALPAMLALLPLAAGVGVLVGRNGGDDSAKVLSALRHQKPVVVTVGGGGGGGSTDQATADSGGGDNAGGTKAHRAKAKVSAATGAKVLTRTKYGQATQVTNYHPSKKTIQRDKKVVARIQRTIGHDYVAAQRNLPDQIVVP